MSNIVDLVSVLLLSIYNYGLSMQPEAILFVVFLDREY